MESWSSQWRFVSWCGSRGRSGGVLRLVNPTGQKGADRFDISLLKMFSTHYVQVQILAEGLVSRLLASASVLPLRLASARRIRRHMAIDSSVAPSCGVEPRAPDQSFRPGSVEVQRLVPVPWHVPPSRRCPAKYLLASVVFGEAGLVSHGVNSNPAYRVSPRNCSWAQ